MFSDVYLRRGRVTLQRATWRRFSFADLAVTLGTLYADLRCRQSWIGISRPVRSTRRHSRY